MFIRAPSKIIISGEHSVVYGHKALCAAINKFTTINIKQHPYYEIKWGNLWHEIVQKQEIHTQTTHFKQIINILQLQPCFIEVSSQIPISSGLGSSASFAVSLTKAINGTLQQAIDIENMFHGKRGSGLDVHVCNAGGLCQFQINKPLVKLNNFNIYKVLLIDSGERKKSGTQGSIEKVKECVDSKDGKNIIERIAQITEAIINSGIQKDLIYENHDLLNKLGICTPIMNEIIRICKIEGVPAKMTGSGDGGFCLAFPQDDDHLKHLLTKFSNYKTLVADLEFEVLLQTLVENGFDQWEQIKELNLEILQELKIQDSQSQIILQIIQDIENNVSSNQPSQRQEKQLSVELMIKGLNKKKDYSKKPPLKNKADQLIDCCVLSLNGMNLTSINDCIKLAQGLQVLHLYDNCLQELVLQDLQLLRVLNVQNNRLKHIQIDQLPNLEKVCLDKNYLTAVPLLPPRLNTLSISNQNTKEFQFPDESFEQVQYTLQQIICENSNVEFILTLGQLQNLELLNLRNNKIKEFDDIEDSISNLQNIKEIDLRGNPITQVYKYRDRIVLLCKTIETIDTKAVLVNERQYLINLGKQKILKRNQSLDNKKQVIQKPIINGIKQRILTNQEQRYHQQQGISKTINSANNFHDLTPIQLTKHK